MTLGLFPLNLVLFPGVRLPLHVFEPRYQTLVNECLDRGSAFGINLLENARMQLVGCTAHVVSVNHRFPDGRLDVVVEGGKRYRVSTIHDDHSPYVLADTVELVDTPEITDPSLLLQCSTLYNKVIGLVFGNAEYQFDASSVGSSSPAFLMAPKSGLSTKQKQELLELTSENERLSLLLTHLSEVVPSIQQAATMQRIIASDGYLKAME